MHMGGNCLSPFLTFFVNFRHDTAEFPPPVLRSLGSDERVEIFRDTLDAGRIFLHLLVPQF